MIQAEVENLTQTFENTTYISSPLYTESWLRSFVGYVRRNQDYLNVSIDTEDDFIRTLKEVRRNFVYANQLPSEVNLRLNRHNIIETERQSAQRIQSMNIRR